MGESPGVVWVAVERWKKSAGSKSKDGSLGAWWVSFFRTFIATGSTVTVFPSFSFSVSRFVEAVSNSEWRAIFKDSTIGLTRNALAPYAITATPEAA